MSNLGDAHFAGGNLAEARRYQAECLQQARQFNDLRAIAAATTELARYALRENALEEAIRLAVDGAAASVAAEDHLYEATALAVEGCARERLGNHATADERFRRAFRMLLDRQALTKLAELTAMYSDLLRDRGQAEDALKFMRMAYERDFDQLANRVVEAS